MSLNVGLKPSKRKGYQARVPDTCLNLSDRVRGLGVTVDQRAVLYQYSGQTALASLGDEITASGTASSTIFEIRESVEGDMAVS